MMLTTQTPGIGRRQAIFFLFILGPVFLCMFILGVFMGRSNSDIFPIAVAAAIMFVIASIIVMGLNWRFGLYAIFFLVLFDRLLGFGETGSLNATKVAIGFTIVYLITAILNNQLPRWYERLVDPLPITAIAFALVSYMGMVYAFAPEWGMQLISRRINIAVLLLLIVIGVTDRDVFHKCMLWLVIGGTIVALITTSEAFTGRSVLEMMGKAPDPEGRLNTTPMYGQKVRFIGPSGDPPFYAVAQSFPGVIAFGYFFYYRKWWQKALLAFAIAIIVFNILGTGARGGVLAFVAGCGVVFTLCPIRNKLPKIALSIVILVGGVIGLLLMDTSVAVNRIADPTQAAGVVDYRTAMWNMCWEMYEDRPVTGMGLNSWGINYEYYRSIGSSGRPLRPLNSFMQMLQESGVQGAFIYCLLYLFAAISAGCAALGTHDRRLKFESAAIFGVIFGFFVFAGTSNVLENELYFLAFGLCGAAYNVYRLEAQGRADIGSRDLMTIGYRYRWLEALEARQNAMYPPGS
ncbi:MAG: O-antigen ligase family protein [Phycisphaerales bacterium]